MPNYEICPLCGGNLQDDSELCRHECVNCDYTIDYNNNAVYDSKGVQIKIITVEELPLVNGWDYPIEEIDYLIEQIKDGDRENGCTMLLFEERLYELEV